MNADYSALDLCPSGPDADLLNQRPLKFPDELRLEIRWRGASNRWRSPNHKSSPSASSGARRQSGFRRRSTSSFEARRDPLAMWTDSVWPLALASRAYFGYKIEEEAGMKSMRARSAAQQRTDEALVATCFKVRIPASRRVTLAVPEEVEPGEAEVIVLHRRAKPASRKAPHAKSRQHPAFGLWASRSEAADTIAFVAELRRRVMERRARLRDA